MARNEEKAQSMLYRFREAQAAELGLGTRSDRRPRMASACKSLRECERWRGEILREISRKVSKIQDSGLTDYEVRDLNDEINRLLREKRHWENQIVALGGANYRRNVAMLDDDGKEVPGTKGYKYFGRAKELPGVKEMFSSKKSEEDEENKVHGYYKKFTNQGPGYFGDLDEADGTLLEYEAHAEEEEWEDAYTHIRTVLGLPTDDPIPPFSRPVKPLSALLTEASQASAPPEAKRKAPDGDTDGDVDMSAAAPSDVAKRARTDGADAPTGTAGDADASTDAAMLAHATRTAAYIPVLSPEILMPPKLPTREEMEQFLLELRKKALVEEYFGDEK
ncbi:Isy1-domain-containing protein [Trametes versicolor FP-101664 SS1]|uniref:Isy1-domain-containing protein n=1 Tax=Trametes versicolor (strain FP-101664) TaxID=717944 RepID=UPI0004621FC6|nr:Isy1-domain-containing protein [Trametes versicolor FP-101664 SS1]EIW53348.1 Isy1-domain-containing protein [Trametes versicolor FP-101664 SS1]